MRTDEGINSEILIKVLGKALGQRITEARFDTEQLHGGTLGKVMLVSGMARTSEGKELPYKVVYKKQTKWERYGDPNSWRREYDLYAENLDGFFSDSFRWPKCYHAELSEDEINLWMEYIEGVSGLNLTGAMLEKAAGELGRFQGRLYAQQPEVLNKLSNLSSKAYSKNYYVHYRSWPEVYHYIRSEECEIPRHLCDMLIDLDKRSDELWERIEQLPVVLCHRDFWVANVFFADQKVRLIDWDTAGWGYMGEDIASLIADEADVAHMIENYERCVKAYCKGFSENVDISRISSLYVKEMILFLYGYRLVEWYKFAETAEGKALQIATLQRVYEMQDINLHC